jgi:SprT protein
MNTVRAKKYAQRMVEIYLDDSWAFKWDLKVNHFGSCQFEKKIITLSNPFTLMNKPEYVHEALMHELAHAITGIREHNREWTKTNLRIGGTGNPYINRYVTKPARASLRSQVQ